AGHRLAFAVSAKHPEEQDCTKLTNNTNGRVQTISYLCVDTAFDGRGGTYHYSIATVRPAFIGTPCKFERGTCTVGGLGRTETVAVAAVAGAQPSVSAQPSRPSASARPEAIGPAPVPVNPRGLSPASGAEGDAVAAHRSRSAVWIAVAILAVLAGALTWRIRPKRAS
ncbi:MAG: hypothetical protein ABR552_07485, partial [Actinomycetota bacterium]